VTTPDSPPHVPLAGELFLGTIVKMASFGAFISLPTGHTGVLHTTEFRKVYSGRKIKNIGDVFGIGDQIQVEILDVDDRGKVSLMPIMEPGR
jgi:polyribonucleotide nucleotidyltransferase